MEVKKVLVSGGTKGIGRAIATKFLDEGYSVIATTRDKTKANIVEHKNLIVENLDSLPSPSGRRSNLYCSKNSCYK